LFPSKTEHGNEKAKRDGERGLENVEMNEREGEGERLGMNRGFADYR